MAVYRVKFTGTDLTDAARAALTAAGAPWEGSESGPEEPCRHRALIEASTEHDAIAAVRKALEPQGSFVDFDAAPVRDSRGRIWQGPFYRSWNEIDWQAEPSRARLTELERAVLLCLADAAEPTWIVLAGLDEPTDRPGVEAVLGDLEREGLVYSVLDGGEPGRDSELDRWWAMTDECWDILGMIKSPRYG